jgi:hypothetical protein
VSVYGQNIFNLKEVSVWWKTFEVGRMAPNDNPKKLRGRPRISHADENCVIVKDIITED